MVVSTGDPREFLENFTKIGEGSTGECLSEKAVVLPLLVTRGAAHLFNT